jgi:hypothetical protein
MSAKKQTKPKSEQPVSVTYKSIRYYFQLFDGLWSIPIAFALFIIAGTLSAEYFGDALISTEYVQYIVLASLVMVFANFVTFLGIRFNFRALQRSVYNREIKNEINNLNTWQKVVLYLVLYAFFFASFLFTLRTLMMATA